MNNLKWMMEKLNKLYHVEKENKIETATERGIEFERLIEREKKREAEKGLKE